ncbi:MAG: 1-deoxy-D-xylulose-5-phosphate synthase [Planctomycetota bacterium]
MTDTLLNSIHSPRDLRRLTPDELPALAEEIRHAICEQVSRTGGHLAPNLGVVELTIALHYVFDFGHDRLLFDVGHQCYPHKLLTGRYPLLGKLRQRGGMSGFPEPKESDFDLFSVGHAGTAISTAVGMARGDDVRAAPGSGRGPDDDPAGASDRKAVVLVGDASIVNGVALEGLNNAGTLQRQFLTVLNDNGMSISQPQGAMASYFDRVRVSPTFHDIKRRGKDILDRLPGGSILEEVYHRGSEMLRAMISHGHMFEHFGHICIGPVDGHDLPTLIATLAEVRDIDRPVLLHVKTVKGKGYEFAEGDATTFHSPKPFKREGCRVEVTPGGGKSFTSAFADAMLDVMADDERVFAVTAAMGPGTGVDKLIEEYPHRTLDTGICESHAMDMCAGLAKSGIKPFFAVYSTFAQRALDQVFQEVALQGLPVRVCMDRAGYVGGDGAVHHGFMDIAMFRSFPGVVQLAACDEPSLRAALRFMQNHDDGASFLRYPRDSVADPPVLPVEKYPAFEMGKAVCVRPAKSDTPDLAILAYGTPVVAALAGLPVLAEHGHDVAVYDARFAQPVDIDLMTRLLNAGVPVLTVEDHLADGGFGSAVLDAANTAGLDTRLVHRHGMPRSWVGPDSRSNQLAGAGLDAAGVAARGRVVLAAAADLRARDLAADRG